MHGVPDHDWVHQWATALWAVWAHTWLLQLDASLSGAPAIADGCSLRPVASATAATSGAGAFGAASDDGRLTWTADACRHTRDVLFPFATRLLHSGRVPSMWALGVAVPLIRVLARLAEVSTPDESDNVSGLPVTDPLMAGGASGSLAVTSHGSSWTAWCQDPPGSSALALRRVQQAVLSFCPTAALATLLTRHPAWLTQALPIVPSASTSSSASSSSMAAASETSSTAAAAAAAAAAALAATRASITSQADHVRWDEGHAHPPLLADDCLAGGAAAAINLDDWHVTWLTPVLLAVPPRGPSVDAVPASQTDMDECAPAEPAEEVEVEVEVEAKG